MNLNKYHGTPYVDGGRVVSSGLDCWGLVRLILHEEYGAPLLNSFCEILPAQHDNMTEQFTESICLFERCRPCAGAIACCFYKSATGDDVFHHVGVVIDGGEVLHTCSERGVSVMPVRAFKRLSLKVEFFKYVG